MSEYIFSIILFFIQVIEGNIQTRVFSLFTPYNNCSAAMGRILRRKGKEGIVVKYKTGSYRNKRKRQQRIIFGIVAAVLSLGLLLSSMVWTLGGDLPADTSAPDGAQAGVQQETLADLEKKVQDNPRDVDALLRLAGTYMQESKQDKAAETYEKALAIEPGNGQIRLDLALTYFLMGQNDKAIENIQQEIKTHPDNKEAHYYLGQVLAYGKNDYQGGIRELEKFIDMAKTGEDVVKAKQMIEEWKTLAGQSPKN